MEHYSPPQWRFRACKVSYGTRVGSCWPGTYTLGGPAYAMTGTDFGVADETIRALRRQNTLENLREVSWERIVAIMAAVLALGVASVAFQASTGRLARQAVVGIVSGIGAFALSQFALTFFLLITGFVD